MATKRKRKDRSAAIVTIRDADKMTTRGRRDIAAWLRRTAAFLVKHGDQYSSRFAGRYMY